jgi:hypothetical protein
MQIETTPWHKTRSLVSPQIEMLQADGVVQYKASFLKDESPKSAIITKRYIHYDTNYVKYCLLKEFYQLLFDGVRRELFEEDSNQLAILLTEVVTGFTDYCGEHPSEENARELFRAFCKDHLF